ncbi:hypothetical protein AT959_02710 [Dechloromonas denitrificans]|uniref:Uncharacterized protein n=1 Tax=Dechloromonas denitrificans TaxID=281362 RepID=A0A133XM48_9RHOO|nr:hypothetical protein [Dechloromonas denitrificans]KXB31990.1 hypothetical protein AT959_02710 [Dechloromonas denitrificans]
MKNSVAIADHRPFFEKAVRYGLEHGLLSRDHLQKIEADAPKGIVQIADHFGTAYLRTDLETAVARMANLISLYLEDSTNGDLRAAALSLRDNTLLSHSRGGSEMLKRLHAMPGDTSLHARQTDPAAQKFFVNERSFAFPLSLTTYRAQVSQCQANQLRIDFARWLARRLNAQPDEYENFSAEEVIHSAMLVLYVGPKTLEMPSKTQFVKLVEALRKKSFKFKESSLEAFLREAPEAFAALTRQSLQEFIASALPRLKSADKSVDEILHAEAQGAFFVREVPEEDVVAYDKLVAREWVRITKGDADDPAVLATIFLNVATGQPPKAAALLKEAKAIIQAFRTDGFDSNAVLAFIDAYAPFEQRDGLKAMWAQDLKPDAEIHLADNDPQMPDAYMERALKYFKQNCVGSWKGSSR